MQERPKGQDKLTLEEITAINPALQEWFRTHDSALLNGSTRLLSAEEKLELLGGSEKINANHNAAKELGFGDKYLVLSACYRDPMHPYGIARFCRLSTSKTLAAANLIDAIDHLMQNGLMVRKEGLTLVTLEKDGTFSMADRNGYLTTKNGFRQRVKILGDTVQKKPSGILAPQR